MPEALSSDLRTQEIPEYNIDELLELLSEDVELLDVQRLLATPPALIASALQRLSVDESRALLRKLDEPAVAQILSQTDAEDAAHILAAMREWRALKVLERFDLDDAADVVSELSEHDRVRLLSKLSEDTAQEVRRLLAYDPDTAGGAMTPAFISVTPDMTVDAAIAHVRDRQEDAKHAAYIYVVDDVGHLLGVFSVRTLILAKRGAKVKDFMESELKGVLRSDEPMEHVAQSMAEMHLHMLPVVDKLGRMIGVVEYDDAIDVLQSEATEDIQRLVGAGPDEGIHDDISYSIQRRCPWLAVNMLTAFVSSLVIAMFHKEIEALSLLAVLMPVIPSLSGNTGAQTLAVMIRSIAIGDYQTFDKSRVCAKEAMKGLLQGVIMGVMSAIIAYGMTGSFKMAIVVMGSLICTMCLAGFVGALIPLVLKRLSFDPAQSASIFLTALTDIFGFLIFLSLGTWLLL